MPYSTPEEQAGQRVYSAVFNTGVQAGEYPVQVECSILVDDPGNANVEGVFQAFIDHVVSDPSYTLPFPASATRTKTFVETITPTP